jgi:hypothetical protein
MAEININPGNFGALAALAGRDTGHLNIPVPASRQNFMQGLSGGLGAMMDRMGQKERLQASKDESGSRLALAEKEMAMKQSAMDRNFNADQAQREFENKRAEKMDQYRYAELDMRRKMLMSPDDVRTRTTAAAKFLDEVQKAETPEQKKAIIQTNLNRLKDSGIIDNKEYDVLRDASPEIVQKHLTTEIITNDKLLSNGLIKGGKYSQSTGGGKKGTGATGGVANTAVPEGNLPITSKTADKAQEDEVNIDENITALNNLNAQYKKDYLGAGGQGKSAVLAARDYASTAPIIGDKVALGPEDKEWLQNRSNFASSSQELSMKIIKQLSGLSYTDKQLEFLRQITPNESDSPSVFEGKMQGMQQRLTALKGIKDELLQKGIKIGTSEYKDAWLAKAKERALAPSDTQSADPRIQKTIEHYKSQGYSEEQIRDQLKKQGILK